jgi:uncharacterized lipoprotein YddW (UPF0748 family)
MKKLSLSLLLFLSLFAVISVPVKAEQPLKREFRGAWIQAVNGQFIGMTTEELQQTLTTQLDALQRAGINAIIFQVRPEADALYMSYYEPWSRYLTGEQGVAPDPYWDPLQWMIDECHRRGMELHAWINPYRAKTKGTKNLGLKHPYKSNPERFVHYDGMLIFNPALKENRDYICTIVTDIVKRYDVDGLHIDDYFYPYPIPGLEFDDEQSFRADPRGFTDKGDWRRDNVNLLVEQLHRTIRSVKPWVKFGISPFGIYRNQKNDPEGSATNGLQNYDELYADILLWIDKGWVDYTIPQLYWEIGHKAADYETLVAWWAEHAAGRPLFVGQDVMRTVKAADLNDPSQHQQAHKMLLQRSYESIGGSCQWPASAVADNVKGYATALSEEYHRWLALQPEFPFIDEVAPGKVKKITAIKTDDGPVLCWTAPKYADEMDRPVRYVIYRFAKGEELDLNDATKIVGFTQSTFFPLTSQDGKNKKKYTYVVTALDRLHNESKPQKTKIKL